MRANSHSILASLYLKSSAMLRLTAWSRAVLVTAWSRAVLVVVVVVRAW